MRAGSHSPSRRDVLLGGTAATVVMFGQGAGAQPVATRLRPDIASSAGATMIRLYERAVRAMQDPDINYPPQPQSWTFQAYIHGVPENPFDPATSGGLRTGTAGLRKRIDLIYGNPASGSPQAAWKEAALNCWGTCTHFSPYFTTWHRWYIFYFERICREMCKDNSFQLPYWNYASNIGNSLQMPQAFWNNTSSRLYFDDRGLGFANPQGTGQQNVAMNNGGYMPYSQTDYGPALSAKVMFPSDATYAAPPSAAYFAFGFTGRLECQPHDNVHDNVGGWMANIPSAAGDPIFYVHHCQVDRLYASWEAVPGVTYNWGTTSTDPSEQTWKSQPAFFVDENGKLVKVLLGGAINTSSLGYGYDNLATPPSSQLLSLRAVAPAAAVPLQLAAMRASNFSVGTGGTTAALQEGAAAPQAAAPSGPTTLVLSDMKLLRRPPAPLSVFINLPKGTAPRLNDPYYVGTINLFNFDLGTGTPMVHDTGAGHAMPGGEMRFDVGEVLRQQRARGLWDGRGVTVSVMTIGADNPGDVTYLTIGSVTLLP